MPLLRSTPANVASAPGATSGAPAVAGVFFATISIWIYGVLGLASMFEEKIKAGKNAAAEEKKKKGGKK